MIRQRLVIMYYRSRHRSCQFYPTRSTMSLLSRISHLLLPGSCLLCGAGSGAKPLCVGCIGDLPRPDGDACPRCGLPTSDDTCRRCSQAPPAFDATLAHFRYDFPVDRLIHLLKYGHRLGLARWFGELLAGHPRLPRDALIVPVPLHVDRLRERGFNQAQEITRQIPGERAAHMLLQRVRATTAQATLEHAERANNVRGAFECSADLGGRDILLVDDVLTTGHTVGEAARVLKLHGAGRITVAAVARAVPRPDGLL